MHTTKPGPGEALQMLKEGNRRFYTGEAAHPRSDAARLELAGRENQEDYAFATVLTCSDSRVPVELVFDAGVMDCFVIRVAGNVCNTDEIASIEYGLAYVRTPLLVVLGHTQCRAVTTAIHMQQGKIRKLERNIPPLISPIIPVVKRTMEAHGDIHGDALVPYVIEENVWQGIDNLLMKSPAVRELVKDGSVMVVGAIYNVGTGVVDWLPAEKVGEILTKVEASPDKETETYSGE